MTAVWIRFRAELRSRWRSWLGLAVVAGLAGGLVIGMTAGARRTESALDRYFAATRLGDAYVYRGFIQGATELDFDRIAGCRRSPRRNAPPILVVDQQEPLRPPDL